MKKTIIGAIGMFACTFLTASILSPYLCGAVSMLVYLCIIIYPKNF